MYELLSLLRCILCALNGSVGRLRRAYGFVFGTGVIGEVDRDAAYGGGLGQVDDHIGRGGKTELVAAG